MRPVHIAGIGQLPARPADHTYDEAEMVVVVASEALSEAGLGKDDIGFFCSGSSDYMMGRPFSFTMAIDGVGLWPPKRESHVEMDGAWALYEAWVRLQHGDVDTALVYAYGKSSLVDVDEVYALQLDPYAMAPLRPDPTSLAAMRARHLLDAGLTDRDALDAIVARSWAAGARNPLVPDLGSPPDGTPTVSPLTARDAARRTDGAACIVLRVGGGGPRIDGFAHITDTHHLGFRDWSTSMSAARAAEAAGARDIDVAELSAIYSSQEVVLRRAMGLDGAAINPSGGALVSDTPFVTGLVRVCEATRAVRSGAKRALAHATTGPMLQHNLVCVLEAS
jgi:acetyl-CoA acetyltransferase